MPTKFEKGGRNLNIAGGGGGGKVLLLVGSRGVKVNFGMNIGTRGLGRRGREVHGDFLSGGVASFSLAKVRRRSRWSERELFSESQ